LNLPIHYALTVTGTSRCAPVKTYCVWTVEENKDNNSGIPVEFQLAVALEHSGPFITEVDVKAELRGRLIPVNYVRAKSTSRSLIVMENWKGKLEEWNFGENWKAFVEAITGEVEGTLVNFKQLLPKP
jgi:hypothetical protein